MTIALFVKTCIFHVNWMGTAEENVEYNPTLSGYRICLHKPAVRAVGTVCVIDDAMTTHPLLSAEETAAHPALKEVPKTLWASSKFDVGLIKNCEPV